MHVPREPMINRLLDLLAGRDTALKESTDKLHLSVAALLVEAARMDGTFDAHERAMVECLLAEKFQLEPEALQSLLDKARQKVEHSAQYFPFTHEICTRLSREERIEIIEMLWTVAYADGALDPEEDMLIRQIAGLIYVPDRERMLARQRALAHLKTASSHE
jgi:uncharacterized tellurite resistance protein B-like protein